MIGADELAALLRDKVDALQAQLLAKVDANLSGGVLQARSGTLKASVAATLTFAGDAIETAIGSDGVAYAAIQEYGGTTAPHDIVPVKAQALAFAGVFARRVHHPGSQIPARAPFGQALEAMRGEIGAGLKTMILDALGAR